MNLLLILALTAGISHGAQTPGAGPALSPMEFRGLLQRFVDKVYLKAFRHLGDERDFDHGHILFDAQSNRPRVILYHTQEMAKGYPTASDFGYINPDARNWIQWIDEDKIENADNYQRKDFPRSAAWAWFVERRLPTLREYRTIVDKMLDPVLVGADTTRSFQWVFTRIDCGPKPVAAPGAEDSIDILLPSGEKVCLALSAA